MKDEVTIVSPEQKLTKEDIIECVNLNLSWDEYRSGIRQISSIYHNSGGCQYEHQG
jgi:hypothetical protein